MIDLWLAKSHRGTIVHAYWGTHTSTYCHLPAGTRLSWAMSVRSREAQLWTTDAHGWPVLTMLKPSSDWAQGYITTENPRQRHFPPKGALP